MSLLVYKGRVVHVKEAIRKHAERHHGLFTKQRAPTFL